jgi:hypothetical protein
MRTQIKINREEKINFANEQVGRECAAKNRLERFC